MSLICADIAESLIFFVANALECIDSVCWVTCMLTWCKLKNWVEKLWKVALSTDWDLSQGLCDRGNGNKSKGISLESNVAVADFSKTGLDVTELGLGAIFYIPYSGASFLLPWAWEGVIPVDPETLNRGEVTMGCLLCCFCPELRSRLRLLCCFQSELCSGLCLRLQLRSRLCPGLQSGLLFGLLFGLCFRLLGGVACSTGADFGCVISYWNQNQSALAFWATMDACPIILDNNNVSIPFDLELCSWSNANTKYTR